MCCRRTLAAALATLTLVSAPPREAHASGEAMVYLLGGLGVVMVGAGVVYPVVTAASGETMNRSLAWVYTGVGGFTGMLVTIADPAARASTPTQEVNPFHIIFGATFGTLAGIGVGGLFDRPRDPWVGASVGIAGVATLHATGTLLGLHESRTSAAATAIAAGVGSAGSLIFGLVTDDRTERIGLLSAAGVSALVTGYEVYRMSTPDLPDAQRSASTRGARLAILPSVGGGQAWLSLNGTF